MSMSGEKIKMGSIGAIATVVIGVMLNYMFTPAFNLHSGGFWIYIGILTSIIAAVVCYIDVNEHYDFETSSFISLLVVLGFLIVAGVGCLASSSLFHAEKFSNVVEVNEGNWNSDMPAINSVDNIALMDTATAKVFGNRCLGGLSDVVSQYVLSENYTQINYNGKPMKVAPLEYADFFKWNKNKDSGIPGYILVDPVNFSAEFVRTEKPIMYSPSSWFSKNLKRTLRRNYRSDIFGNSYFEIDENGNPYWVTSVYSTTAGVFGGRVITEVIIMDACTGKCEKLAVNEVPEWVDVVFDGDYIMEKVTDHGMLKNGFWNALFSATGCTRTTADFGYVTIDNDIWVYTGITSATSDSSNIGVILANERTCEIKYYEMAGADEISAMEAAMGEVQQFGYVASFPSIINVNGEPTYIMVLKDANNIVKSYAMVNVKNYSKVVVAETQEEVFAKYVKKLNLSVDAPEETEEDSVEEIEENINYETAKFVVKDIKFITTDGNTTVYITTESDEYLKCAFDEFWITVKAGETVNASVQTDDVQIKLVKDFSK